MKKFPKNQVHRSRHGKWRAKIFLPEFNRFVNLGSHNTEEEARAAKLHPRLQAYIDDLRDKVAEVGSPVRVTRLSGTNGTRERWASYYTDGFKRRVHLGTFPSRQAALSAPLRVLPYPATEVPPPQPVVFQISNNRWEVFLQPYDGKRIFLGSFDSAEAAEQAAGTA